MDMRFDKPTITVALIILLCSLPISTTSIQSHVSVAATKHPGSTTIGSTILQFGSEGTAEGQFELAYGVGIDNDLVYITDYDSWRISIFDLQGNFIEYLGWGGPDGENVINPIALAFDERYIYVGEQGNDALRIYSKSGKFQSLMNLTGVDSIYAIEMNETRIFILDFDAEIHVFDFAGNKYGVYPVGNSLTHAMDLYNDQFYVADIDTDAIYVYNMTFQLVQGIGFDANIPFDLATVNIESLDVDNNFIYAASGSDIIVYDIYGNPHAKFNKNSKLLKSSTFGKVRVTDGLLVAVDQTYGRINYYSVDVTDVSAQVGDDEIRVSWGNPSILDGANVTHYNVYRGTSSGNYDLIAALTEEYFIDTAVLQNQNYHYAVTAVNDFGETIYSLEVRAMIELPARETVIQLIPGNVTT
ncbi:MAG: hypothetical protein IH840_11665, partial [Candidatus Heimdallarchaeota archaeon]|nr:hypothetical protein [Candidatus Heimdallarchaeota archaeon]